MSVPRPGSLRTAGRALLASPDRILVPTLVLSVTGVALHVVAQYLLGLAAGSAQCGRNVAGVLYAVDCGPTDNRALLTLVAGLFVLLTIGHLVVAGINRACLDLVAGRPPAGPFTGWVRPGLVLTAVALGFVLTLNTLFLLVPGIAFAFVSRYALLFADDQQLGWFAAVVHSARFVFSDLGHEILFVLKACGVLLLGALALGIGLYVAVPVVLLAQADRFRARTAPGSAGTVGVQPEHRTGQR